jgi:hypothetical protein
MLTAMGVHDQLIEKSWSLEQVQGAVAKAFGDTADEINRGQSGRKKLDPKRCRYLRRPRRAIKLSLLWKSRMNYLKFRMRDKGDSQSQDAAAKVTDNQNQISAAGSWLLKIMI